MLKYSLRLARSLLRTSITAPPTYPGHCIEPKPRRPYRGIVEPLWIPCRTLVEPYIDPVWSLIDLEYRTLVAPVDPL